MGWLGKFSAELNVERRGFVIRDLNMMTATEDLVAQHYEHLTDKTFFPLLVDYMTSGPVIAGILEGPEVVKSWRDMMGLPIQSMPYQEPFEEISPLHQLMVLWQILFTDLIA